MSQMRLSVGTLHTGSTKAVVASGTTSISLSLIFCQPQIDGRRSRGRLKTSLSSLMGTRSVAH